MELAIKYADTDVIIGLGAPTIAFMKKTFVLDLEIILKRAGIAYEYNKQDNVIILNGVKFVMVATGYPSDIYGYTFSAFLCDELDELNPHYGEVAFTAIDERCSKPFPDGRPPFMAVFSTAQGYRVCYTKTRELREKKIPFVLVRGCTKDNYHNDPSYYENRYKLYSENERLAYLEGHFVNLTSGRVYPDFDEDSAICDPFEIETNETIYVGQDKNIGYNKAVCYIKRDKQLYLIRSFSFQSISDAPRILRSHFPTHTIFWYPDVTAKEIIAGYSAEIKNHGINLRVGTVNPGIISRIFVVNKLHKAGRVKIFKGNTEFCNALKTRCYDKNGMPEKSAGETAPDHFCDCNEYVLWRLVMVDPDFEDIRKVTAQVKAA